MTPSHTNIHKNFENVLKVKYCKMNKEINSLIANITNNARKLPNIGQNMQK
jgi:hypothetical protein